MVGRVVDSGAALATHAVDSALGGKAGAVGADLNVAASHPAAVVVIYNQPKDTAAFEKYYASTHIPLVQQYAKEIGFSHAELVKFPSNLDGTKPHFYRMAQLWFRDEADLKRGTSTEGFKKVAGDLSNFASGGVVALAGSQTN
jgi:uncharacterized protein (TIGR02118 family)